MAKDISKCSGKYLVNVQFNIQRYEKTFMEQYPLVMVKMWKIFQSCKMSNEYANICERLK